MNATSSRPIKATLCMRSNYRLEATSGTGRICAGMPAKSAREHRLRDRQEVP